MKPRHRSTFSYNITRPYPYRWFTPVTIVGGLILAILFSWLNYAANGFEMVVITSADPNATIHDRGVLGGLPKLLTGKYKPNCQPANIPVNSRFFTNNSGLEYELLGVTYDSPKTGITVSPALTYNNNVFEECNISSVQLEFSSLDRTGVQLPMTFYGTVVRSYANCLIRSDEGESLPETSVRCKLIEFRIGQITFNITNAYDLMPAATNIALLYDSLSRSSFNVLTNFVSRDPKNRASLWWGESILSAYWMWFVKSMDEQNIEPETGGKLSKGSLSFRPNFTSTGVIISDPHFLEINWRTVLQKPTGAQSIYWAGEEADKANRHASDLAEAKIYPETWWLPAEKLAKSAWSTILVDLGQTQHSNVLLDNDLLKDFTSDFDERHTDTGNIRPGPETGPYDAVTSTTGPLGTNPAVIETRYICNIPRRKATSTIVWSILLADLVFLQAVWKIFKLVVDTYVERGQSASESRADSPSGALLRVRGHYHAASSVDDDSQDVIPLARTLHRPGYQRQSTGQL